MRIIHFKAENVKRLKAVEITPDGDLQVIGGRNAQGKSSVLDAIYLALAGGTAARQTTRPVRDGEDSASVSLDLGDLKVHRTWDAEGHTKLKVLDGADRTLSSPQKVLDKLLGKLTFDPLAFTRLSDKEQVQELLNVVDLGFDLDDNAARRQATYEQRTEVGRRIKEFGAIAGVDTSLPETEVSSTDLLNRINDVETANRARVTAEQDIDAANRRIEALDQKISELQAEREREAGGLLDLELSFDSLPPVQDVQGLREQLLSVDQTNRSIRANNEAKAKQAQVAQLESEQRALTAQIEAIDKEKTDALASASFPIEGLSFDETGVTYNGVSFSQASSAEKIRVSLAIAMSLNPELRVLRIMDGSLLDDESMRLIADQVKGDDFQLWIERVGDGDESAVIIEDGQVLNGQG